MDVFLVRKLGVPWQPELAMGAIASGSVLVMNDRVVQAYGITAQQVDEVIARERHELERREHVYRHGREPLAPAGRDVLLVDDGLATGTTMIAAVRALGALAPASVTVAVPVAPPNTVALLRDEVDEVICVETPDPFWGVGEWYETFDQTTDQEVTDLLARAEAMRVNRRAGEHRPAL
jgi:predicted phosphoribosyltransferase